MNHTHEWSQWSAPIKAIVMAELANLNGSAPLKTSLQHYQIRRCILCGAADTRPCEGDEDAEPPG